ncbi:GTPase HflX [Clostridium felsineum]|uniref:GTPase HflX n=1 Tax=Clostridium felsineum TaxID=36839 RepID=A0A1S8L767_9CLOT|nr:GTPase HflX [Clostridium felsineum]URZ07181.1 GTPase HflX [Clostridium felsineum]URZ12210.1 GTPase HflX [Clostridium felsineum]
MISGNTQGVRNSLINELEKLYDMYSKESIFTIEIINLICRVTNLIEREISVAIDRKGKILSVSIGDARSVETPLFNLKERKLSGIRIIHTHPSGNPRFSDIDISSLLNSRLDAIVAVGALEGNVTGVSIGFCDVENNKIIPKLYNSISIEEAINFKFIDEINYAENHISNLKLDYDDSERAIIVGVDTMESLEELKELADACGVLAVEKVIQKKEKIDNAYFIGKGKVDEIRLLTQVHHANVIIFDDELSGAQVRNLEEAIGLKVIDRTTLILEIFARRAGSKEAKLQVELAQLKYRMPRLMGLGKVLSRTGGGIGTKGPGEKKLEIDRRHISERVYEIQKELRKIKTTRQVQRERRVSEKLPCISLVGYTNAGKSTLRNAICEIAAPLDSVNKESVLEKDMLFATLDVTTRAINLVDGRRAVLTDTVGFVRKLPHDLVEAFKSTLEEVVYSDLLVHVVDAASDTFMEQIEAVNGVLKELGASDKTQILVLNKIDKLSEEKLKLIKERIKEEDIIEISAKNKVNLDLLMSKMVERIPSTTREVEYLIPYADQKIVSYIHEKAIVKKEDFENEGTHIVAVVDNEVYNKCNEYMM